MKTHRVYIPKAGQAFLAEQELDDNLKPTEVLIKSHYSGISAGTETARYLGLDGDIFPTTSGGANVGEIVAVGSSVTQFAIGDRVTSFTNHDSFLKCDTVPRDFGYNGHRIGMKVPAALGGASAALVYHFNVSMAAVRESGVVLGDDALVIGGGLIGNSAAQLFRCAGASVMLADLSEKRLAIARECGVTRTVNPSKTKLADAVKEWTQGRMLHHVVQAIEGADVIEETIPLMRRNGQMVLLGGYRRSQSVDARIFGALQGGSRRMVAPSAWSYPVPEAPHHHFSIFGHYRQLMTLIEEGRIRTDPLITLVHPQDCQEVFQDLIHNKDRYLGAVFDWTKR